jgi:hypothetical protein
MPEPGVEKKWHGTLVQDVLTFCEVSTAVWNVGALPTTVRSMLMGCAVDDRCIPFLPSTDGNDSSVGSQGVRQLPTCFTGNLVARVKQSMQRWQSAGGMTASDNMIVVREVKRTRGLDALTRWDRVVRRRRAGMPSLRASISDDLAITRVENVPPSSTFRPYSMPP